MIPYTHPALSLGLDPDESERLLGTLGGVHADLFGEDRHMAVVRIEEGELVVATEDRERGLALRVLHADGGTHLASTSGMGRRAALGLAADLTRAPAPAGIADSAAEAERASPDLGLRIQLAFAADRIARGVSPFVRQVSVGLRDGARRTVIAARGTGVVAAASERAMIAIEVVAEKDGVRAAAFEAAGGSADLSALDLGVVEATARLVATRAVRLLSAAPAEAKEMPVVLAAEAGGTFVHEAVGHSLEADLVLEGLSLFAERIGETIASPFVSVADDATLPGKNGSFVLDDEGVPAERSLLVERGVLRGYLHDRRSALLLGARPNGKGRRESFRHRPVVRMSNTLILSGSDDPAAILRDTEQGLYVVRMGGGEVDTVTGRFVFEVNEAYRIEHGALGEPVRGATLTGSAEDVLRSIDRVGSDLGFGIGTCGKDGQDVPVSDAEPTIRIPRLVVGGTA